MAIKDTTLHVVLEVLPTGRVDQDLAGEQDAGAVGARQPYAGAVRALGNAHVDQIERVRHRVVRAQEPDLQVGPVVSGAAVIGRSGAAPALDLVDVVAVGIEDPYVGAPVAPGGRDPVAVRMLGQQRRDELLNLLPGLAFPVHRCHAPRPSETARHFSCGQPGA
ncbi:hypothetical protein [Planobispora longispora]|uniref:hypothetical protein n=1 Tax=Planobispora longispora TaxID=28887 RepID=UPI0019416DEE|nr:hypothetical protein [Planobispora longispora]